MISGCNIVGGGVQLINETIMPGKKVQAEHDMQDKDVLIWVDDVALDGQYVAFKKYLTQKLSDQLEEHQAAKSIVQYKRIAHYRVSHPEYSQQTIAELGQAFNADHVLYVLINDFTWVHEAGEGYYRPKLTGYVKVIDATSGDRLWPKDQIHFPLVINANLTQGQGSTFETKLMKEFSEQISQRVSPCFYEHRKEKY